MDISNLINYPAEREVAYGPNQEVIVQEFSSNPVSLDEVEADFSQEHIPVKVTGELQCSNLLQ